MSENTGRQEVAQLGKYGLIENLSGKFKMENPSSVSGIGEDASVIKNQEGYMLTSSKIFLENIHFDLTYFPLKHLGYKCVAVGLSDILGMNGIPQQIRCNIAISNRFSVEAMKELMEGMRLCCSHYKIDLLGLDITSSQSGMVISIETIGNVDEEHLVSRNRAQDKELICVSGDLGGAYTGLILLEREKKVFEVNPDMKPNFAGYDYLLERQLKPEPRLDIIRALRENDIIPTSMINVSEGLATALIQLCRASYRGCAIYEDKLPIDILTFNTLKELKIVATTVALNGGEDYEILFTIKQDDYEKIQKVKDISVIGYIDEESAGMNLITNDEKLLPLKAQGFGETE